MLKAMLTPTEKYLEKKKKNLGLRKGRSEEKGDTIHVLFILQKLGSHHLWEPPLISTLDVGGKSMPIPQEPI